MDADQSSRLRGAAAASTMDLEELAETISQTLCNLQLNQLQEKCVEAKIPSGNATTRRALIRLITKSMDKVINDQEQDVALCYLRKMLKSVDPIMGSQKGLAQASRETMEDMRLAERRSQFQSNSRTLQDEIRRLSERVDRTPPSQLTIPQNMLPVGAKRLLEVTIRREFTICGQIGERGLKERLSYANPMQQFDRGLNKGHRKKLKL